MTDSDTPDLTALIGSRICHDLVNPLGALGNGVELLQMLQEPSAELDLMAQSVAQAQGMVRLFRLAFGAAQADQQVTGREMRAVLDAMAPLQIEAALPDEMPRSDARLMVLLLMCCQSALPRGGPVSLTGHAGAWTLTATGERLRIDPALWQTLGTPGAAPVSAAQVHFALVPGALAASGRRLAQDLSDQAITLSF